MSFEELYKLDLVSYVREHRLPDALWGFVHIAKAAGSSMIAEMSHVKPPYYNIFVENYGADNESHEAMMQRAIQRFLTSHATERQSCFSGHLTVAHALRIKGELPGTRFFTMLRDPVNRVISTYRYAVTPREPTHLEFAARYPTIDDYIADPQSQNLMCQLLRPRSEAGIDETIEFALEFFDFIGLVEMYPMSVSAIFYLMGCRHLPREVVNVTENTPDNAIDPTPDLHQRILSVNRGDEALYRRVFELLNPWRSAWWEFIQVNRQAPGEVDSRSEGPG